MQTMVIAIRSPIVLATYKKDFASDTVNLAKISRAIKIMDLEGKPPKTTLV